MSEITNAKRAKKRLNRNTGRAFWVRTAAVALFDAGAIFALTSLVANETWSVVALLGVVGVLVNWAYLSPRTAAARWLTPGLVLMAFFVLYPVMYTMYVSLTNWQTGNVLSKDQAIELLEARTIQSGESGEVGALFVYLNADDELALLVQPEGSAPYLGFIAGDDRSPAPAADLTGLDIDLADPPEAIGDFELLTRLRLTGQAGRLEGAEVDLPDGRAARVETLATFRLVTGGQRFVYDASSDTLLDVENDRICDAGEGTFVCDGVPEEAVARLAIVAKNSAIGCVDGTCDNVPLFALDGSLPGWREVVGFDNYTDLLTNERIRTPFLRVLAWNVVFAAVSVLTTFGLGLGLAMIVQHESMRGRNVYRSIFIIPYAVPGFLSILVWRGLLNSDFGKVNGVIEFFGLPGVDWLGSPRSAMAAVLLVNLWLGFPYMFLISSGALTSIPSELLEAAKVDGATPSKSFRMVTLPLLLVSTAPLLIGSFAFNFNNFILIYLLSGGGPPFTGYDVPVGSTDLLISFTFDLAQASGRGSQFGLSSAIVFVIFVVLATTSAMSFRLTKKLEEIYDQ